LADAVPRLTRGLVVGRLPDGLCRFKSCSSHQSHKGPLGQATKCQWICPRIRECRKARGKYERVVQRQRLLVIRPVRLQVRLLPRSPVPVRFDLLKSDRIGNRNDLVCCQGERGQALDGAFWSNKKQHLTGDVGPVEGPAAVHGRTSVLRSSNLWSPTNRQIMA
jgi:hypothetical protein